MTQSFPEIAKWIGTYLVGSDADSNNMGTQKMGQIEVQILLFEKNLLFTTR